MNKFNNVYSFDSKLRKLDTAEEIYENAALPALIIGGTDANPATQYASGGRIHIKKENEGKFSAAAKRAGMSTQAYANKIMANKERYSPEKVKQANFAKNASKWKHALGGDLYNALAYGGWTAPVNRYDTGGRTNWYDYNYADVKNYYRQQGVKGKNAETLDQVVDQLNESGLSEAAKKAILQTIYRESGFNAGAHNNIAGGHTGLIQYSGDRWNALKDRSVRGQVENIIGSVINPVMGRDVIDSYLPQGVRSSQDAAQFFSGITNPQDFMYYWNSSSIRNGSNMNTVLANARAMANSGAYLDQNGNLTGYTPGTMAYEQRPYVNYDELMALSQMLNDPNGLGIEGYARASNNDSPAIMADMQAQEEMSKRQQVENTAALLGLPTVQDLAVQAFGLDNARTQAAQDNSSLGSYFRLMNGGSNGVLSFGGELGTQGGNFTNGLLSIDEGGSHESNPLEGVPMGTDNQGTPNVVEEGETIYNDYVFSKRLYLPNELKNKYHLGGKRKKITFAEASKKLAEESRERPNDPISKDGLDMFMQELRDAQEDVKMKKQQDKMLALQEMMQAMGGVPVGPQQPMPMQQGQPGMPGGMGQQEALMAMMGGGQEAALAEEGEPTEEGEEEVPEEETNYAAYGGRLNKFAGDLLGTLTNPVEYPGLVYDDATSLYTLDPNYNITGLGWDAENANAAYQNLTQQLLAKFATAYQNAADDAAKQKLQKSYIGQAIAEAYKFNNSENADHKDFDWSSYNADNIKSDWFKNLTYTLTEKPKPAEKMDTRIIDALAAAQKPTNMGNIPTIMSGLQVLSDALGFNGPDYTEADALVRRGINGTYQRVTPTLISEKRKFVPLDENTIANSIRAKHAGNMRMIANTAGNNRGLLEAAMLADRSSYGTGTSAISELADAYAAAREYNDKTRGEVAEFNRATDQANAQDILQAQKANQSAGLQSRAQSDAMIEKGMDLRQAERQAVDEAHGKNLSSFMTNLENQYKSNLAYNQLLMVAAAGGFGNLDPKILGAWLGVDLPETEQKETETETTPTVTYQSLNQATPATITETSETQVGKSGNPPSVTGASATITGTSETQVGKSGNPPSVTGASATITGTPTNDDVIAMLAANGGLENPAYIATNGWNYFGASAGSKLQALNMRLGLGTQNIGFGSKMPSINIGYNVPSQDVWGNTYQVGKSSNPSSVTGASSTATQETASMETAGQKAAEGSDHVTSKLAGKQPSSFRWFNNTDLGDGIKVSKRGLSSVNVWQNGKRSIYIYDKKTGKWALRENGVRNNDTDNPNPEKKQASTNTNNSGTSSTNISSVTVSPHSVQSLTDGETSSNLGDAVSQIGQGIVNGLKSFVSLTPEYDMSSQHYYPSNDATTGAATKTKFLSIEQIDNRVRELGISSEASNINPNAGQHVDSNTGYTYSFNSDGHAFVKDASGKVVAEYYQPAGGVFLRKGTQEYKDYMSGKTKYTPKNTKPEQPKEAISETQTEFSSGFHFTSPHSVQSWTDETTDLNLSDMSKNIKTDAVEKYKNNYELAMVEKDKGRIYYSAASIISTSLLQDKSTDNLSHTVNWTRPHLSRLMGNTMATTSYNDIVNLRDKQGFTRLNNNYALYPSKDEKGNPTITLFSDVDYKTASYKPLSYFVYDYKQKAWQETEMSDKYRATWKAREEQETFNKNVVDAINYVINGGYRLGTNTESGITINGINIVRSDGGRRITAYMPGTTEYFYEGENGAKNYRTKRSKFKRGEKIVSYYYRGDQGWIKE